MQELRAASDYENIINTAFKQLKKQVIPMGIEQSNIIYKEEDEPELLDKDPLILQKNIADTNLKKIIDGPSLINVIKEQLTNKNEISDFNKNFNIFQKAIGSKKIRNINTFDFFWNEFQKQQLGKELTPDIFQPEDIQNIIGLVPSTQRVNELEKLSNETLNDIFKKSLEEHYNKSLDKIINFQYPLKKPKLELSNTIKLDKSDLNNITFSLAGVKEGNTKEQKINNIKIRFIIYNEFPKTNFKLLNTNWVGESSSQLIGSGLSNTKNSTLNNIIQKKKSVTIIFP